MRNLIVICLTNFVTESLWASSPTKVISVGEVTLDQNGRSAPLTVEMPAFEGRLKAVSALIMVSGEKSHRYEINFLGEEQKFNIDEKFASGVPGTGSILVPNNPAIPFQSGTWRFEVIGKPVAPNEPPSTAKVHVVVKFADTGLSSRNFRGQLKINFVLVDPSATDQPVSRTFTTEKRRDLIVHLSDFLRRPRFRDGKTYQGYLNDHLEHDEASDTFKLIFDGRTIAFNRENADEIYLQETVRYSRDPKVKEDLGIDVRGTKFVKTTYSGSQLTKSSLDNGGLNQLFKKDLICSDCLNIFLVDSSLMSDSEVNGYSSGQPGHFGFTDSASAGVVAFVDPKLRALKLAGTLAHEIGHFLGLPHEEFSRRFTDVSGRGSNLMQTMGFPDPDGRAIQGFTPQQMLIMLGHPLVDLD